MSNCHTYRGQETHLLKETDKGSATFLLSHSFFTSGKKKTNLCLNEDVCHITATEFCTWELQIYLNFMHWQSSKNFEELGLHQSLIYVIQENINNTRKNDCKKLHKNNFNCSQYKYIHLFFRFFKLKWCNDRSQCFKKFINIWYILYLDNEKPERIYNWSLEL